MREAMRGGIIELWCRFTKHNKGGTATLVDPTGITVEIQDPDGNAVSGYTYGVQGNFSRQARGIYRLDYPIPTSAAIGTWKDIWTASIDGDTINVENTFVVVTTHAAGGSGGPVLQQNTIYSIEFSKGIKDSNGSELLEPLYYVFTTTLDPMYATVNAVRTHYGTYTTTISDMAIALVIHDASIEVNAIMPSSRMPTDENQLELLQHAMYRYTLCSAAHKILGEVLAMLGGSKRSRLGDLDISYGPGVTGVQDDWKDAEACMKRWILAIESMGMYRDVIPGASADRGRFSADRMDIGRTIDPSVTRAFGANSSAYRYSLITGQYGRRPVRTWTAGGMKRSY